MHPLTRAGADCSAFTGPPVAGLLSWLSCRSLDEARGRELVRGEGIMTAEH